MNSETSNTALRLAEFLRQALDLNEEANSLAGEIVPFKQDSNAGIYSIELESSVGVAPFLIYHYLLESTNTEDRTGRELFDVDLKTLERAATIDSPGPRIMAHAIAGDEAFILATTPATHRVLTGQDRESGLRSAELQTDTSTSSRIRHEAATKLVEALADANQLAAAWLSAIRSDEGGAIVPSPGTDFIEFNEAETALALYVLDDRSIKDLLAVLNLMIESARSLTTEQNGNSANGVD
ncbi:hypothetical protein BH23CHL5_BH23CHL5_00720 [soil metagenome]